MTVGKDFSQNRALPSKSFRGKRNDRDSANGFFAMLRMTALCGNGFFALLRMTEDVEKIPPPPPCQGGLLRMTYYIYQYLLRK
jgi:hypothetical protein